MAGAPRFYLNPTGSSTFTCATWARAAKEGFWKGQVLYNRERVCHGGVDCGADSFICATDAIACWGGCMSVPVATFYLSKGRFYYVAGVYPMLLAMGAVAGERWVDSLKRGWRLTVESLFFAGVAAWGVLAYCILVPLASSGPLREFALKNNGWMNDRRFG